MCAFTVFALYFIKSMGDKLFAFALHYIHLFILGGALMVSSVALMFIEKFDMSRLQAFGPTAQIYFVGINNGVITATIILLISFVAATFFGAYLEKIQTFLKNFYLSLSNNKRNILILLICIVFSFATHVGNIMNGYFVTDDFTIINLNHSESFPKAVLTPYGNDHVLPLFRTEMKVIDTVFGQNALPFNAFIFILFALTPFFVYLTFRRLGIGMLSFLMFLTLYSGATSWADMLTGYYTMTLYLQILFFFSMAIWTYITWNQLKERKYLILLGASVALALAIDISGIWVIPSILLFIAIIGWIQSKTSMLNALAFLKENKHPLIIVVSVSVFFVAFWAFSFTVIQPDTFLSTLNSEDINKISSAQKSETWKLIPLTENFVSFFSSGVSLPIVAPSVVKILTHPSIRDTFDSIWPIFELIIFVINILFFQFVFKHSARKEKGLILWLLGGMILTIVMVILARPNHNPIPDFDYRYAGAPFFFYAIFLAISASILLKSKKEYSIKLLISLMVIFLATQQAFSFHALRLKVEAEQRTAAVVQLKNSLLTELVVLKTYEKNSTLLIPNLLGGHIFQTMSGISLADYVTFFNPKMPIRFIRNNAIPSDPASNITVIVPSLRASTSPEFKDALMEQGVIRSYYISPALMSYSTIDKTASSIVQLTTKGNGDVLIQRVGFDPEKKHVVGLTLSTDDTPGNLELSFFFKNDFNADGTMGNIRIDDYTFYKVEDDRRIYAIETDLLQIYAYALSDKISDLTLYIPETKNPLLIETYFR